MKLTTEEVVIMKKVRELMQAAYDDPKEIFTKYICWTILEAVEGRNMMHEGPSLQVMMTVVGGEAARLYKHITWALRDQGTMTNFIGMETMRFGYSFSNWAMKFEAEARLAWLDRIIEMEDIK